MIGGLTPVLASIIGTKKAAELVLLCEDITALELQSFGLVNKVVKGDAALDHATLSFASKIAVKPEVTLHSVKLQLRGIYYREQLGNITETDADLALIPGLRQKVLSAAAGTRARL